MTAPTPEPTPTPTAADRMIRERHYALAAARDCVEAWVAQYTLTVTSRQYYGLVELMATTMQAYERRVYHCGRCRHPITWHAIGLSLDGGVTDGPCQGCRCRAYVPPRAGAGAVPQADAPPPSSG